MKFRLPFQIYRTGVISRSNSPRKIINKFSKDNEAKVRKKTSKINSSYRAIISNYIYRFTHLPLKRTMSKLRNRAILRSAAKAHTSKMRNEFVFLQEPSRANSTRRKPRSDEVTNQASECYMNSTKCANFMCAKSTARILLKQKDILCNKTSNKSVTADDTQTQENQKPKDEPPKTPAAQVTRDTKATSTVAVAAAAAVAAPVQKIEKTVEIPTREKWKIRPENHNKDSEIKRLKRIIQSSDRNRNYKVEEAPPAPIRMDNVVGVPHFPKKLPKLPVQTMPKIEQVRPKEGPTLVAPKRKYDSPEMTRNYKITEDVSHGPPRMDNLVARNAKRFQSTTTARTIPTTEGSNKKIKPSNIQTMKNNITVKEEKDALHFSNDLMPKTKIPTRSLQQLNAANINVSERIKKYEELIKNNYDKHRSKSEGSKSRLCEKKLTQGQQLEKKEHSGILAPKLSPFAIAEIRRKYYPPDTFEKQPLKITPQMTFEVPIIEKNDQPNTKLKHFYSQPKQQYKKLDVSLLEINPTGNIKKKHTKTRKIIVCNTGVEKGRDLFTLDLDSSNSLLDYTTTNSTVEPTNINLLAPKVMIPPPSKSSITTKNKRNFSSSAIDDCQEAYNICNDLINISNINMIYSDLTATPTKRKISSNSKKSGEVLPEVKAKKPNRNDATTIPIDIDTLKQDRKFSTDVLTRNLEDRNSREIDRNIMMSTNASLHRSSQRNLSKRHCAIKVTSTLDNQVNIAPPTGASDKLARQLSYRYYEQCTLASINIPPTPITAINEQNTENIEINANDLLADEGYHKMLNEKTNLINDYIKWKMQLQKFGTLPKKLNEPAKYCQNLSNKINKQNKFRLRKYKIIRRKQRTPSTNSLQVNQDQNDAITTTVNLIKNQVAQKCALFDKISDALLKKSDTIKYCEQAAQQQKEERRGYLQDNKKRKLSFVPMLDIPPKRRYTPNNNMETSNIVPPLEINTKPKTAPCREVKINSPGRETNSAFQKREVQKPVSPRKENIQQVSPRPQQFSPRKELPQQCSPRKELPQQCSPRKELPQQCSPRKELPQKCSPRKETPQQFSPRKELSQQFSPRKELPQQLSPRKEIPQPLSPRKEIPQQLSPKKETKPITPKREVLQEVSPRKEIKPTTPKREIPKPVSPRKDIRSPRMETRSCIPVLETEPMEIDVPFNSIASSIDNRRSYSRSSFKLKGPKATSRESSRLESKSNLLPHSIKIKPHTIPATMKAKKFLAKIEAGPDTAGNLIKRIDRKTIKGPKSKTRVLAGGDNLSKYVS